MEKRIFGKSILLIFILILIILFLTYKSFFTSRIEPPSILPPQERDIPVTFRTEGGLLEVAGMIKTVGCLVC